MKICLLDNTEFAYSYEDKYSDKLRGAETVLINLYQELTKIGHDVYVFNNCSDKIHNNQSKWYNLNTLKFHSEIFFDIAFANADVNLFNKISSNKKFIISYSLQTLEKFIRKKQFFSYLKHKPKVFVLGDYHKNKRSWITSIFGVGILELAVDEIFINTELTNNIDKNLAIFTSRPDRNLSILIDIWNNYIHKSNNDFKLLVTPGLINVPHNNIIERELGSQQKLIYDLLKSRIFLVPGHKAELFCLAAEEARELCIPTVTLGIGSLSERVVHEQTGFVASNNKEFAEFTVELFTNDSLWNRIRSNLIELRAKKKWSNSVRNLMQQIN